MEDNEINTQDIQSHILPQYNVDLSREDAVDCSYNLLQTHEDSVPVEGMDFPLACHEHNRAAEFNSMNIREQKSCSSVNLPAGEQPEQTCPHESNGTSEAELLPLSETILPIKVDMVDRESFEQVSKSVSEELQQPPPPPFVNPIKSRSIKPNSKSVIAENPVIQKLLRRWRYFDSGEENSHLEDSAVNSRRTRPQYGGKACFLCGQLKHRPKKCPGRRTCYRCKGKGHSIEQCPVNENASERICLRCGETGHEIFSCNNEYSPDDLKNIRCYVCNEVGHIFCGNDTDISPTTVSCYNCGESGHSGLACLEPHLEKCGLQPPTICYKCGEEGHLARKCINDVEVSTLSKTGQNASPLAMEANDVVYQNRKRARRSKTFKFRRLKKRKMSGLLEYMTV